MWGSPPRGRGKVYPFRVGPVAVRITPAWAGKSSLRRPDHSARWDHPRVGGEKLSCISLLGELLESPPQGGEKELDDRFKTAELGSPPRRRGKVHSQLLVVGIVRITPAWAGKSLFCFTAAVPIQDHPRMGGEKACLAAVSLALAGSPPRRLGKGKFRQRLNLFKGITPA